jgi:uncharacterized damage-inducible protein DinB
MFLASLNDEVARTRRLLNAYPAAQSEMRPHPTSNNARELAHTLSVEAMVSIGAITNTLDMSKLGALPPAPATWGEVLTAFDNNYKTLVGAVEKASEADFGRSVTFFTGPKQMGQVPVHAILQLMLNDQIHHRGQLSVYLRMSGSKVPSIYGPSKDEPWS